MILGCKEKACAVQCRQVRIVGSIQVRDKEEGLKACRGDLLTGLIGPTCAGVLLVALAELVRAVLLRKEDQSDQSEIHHDTKSTLNQNLRPGPTSSQPVNHQLRVLAYTAQHTRLFHAQDAFAV